MGQCFATTKRELRAKNREKEKKRKEENKRKQSCQKECSFKMYGGLGINIRIKLNKITFHFFLDIIIIIIQF